MGALEAKYNLLVSHGWGPALPLPFVSVPVGDGAGRWFTWATATGLNIAVYHHPSVGAFEVHGAILNTYLAEGGPMGELGYPVTDEYADSVGRVSDFQSGSIFWSQAMGRAITMLLGPVTVNPGAHIRLTQFLTGGTGLTSRPLGPTSTLVYVQNGVELQFEVDAAAQPSHLNLRPAQWSGPEAIWTMRGSPLASQWELYRRSDGSGEDNPEPENVSTSPTAIAYYDAPGINVGIFGFPRCSRVWAVQNFTGWIVGDPVSGGPAERVSEVVAWHSTLNIADDNWNNPIALPSWSRYAGSGAALGWGDSSAQPP
jgi:LGFP repeat-containing protein